MCLLQYFELASFKKKKKCWKIFLSFLLWKQDECILEKREEKMVSNPEYNFESIQKQNAIEKYTENGFKS